MRWPSNILLLLLLGTLLVIAHGLRAVSAQEPSFADIMRRAHEAVVEYEDDLSTVIAEEHYEQRVLNKDGVLEQQRVLLSDYWVTQLLPYEGWFGVRDVFAVDGEIVRERTPRLYQPLRLSPGEDGYERLVQIAEDNARFNIGDVVRTLNEPTFVLSFLRPSNRDRMRFVPLGEERIEGLSTTVVGYREIHTDGPAFVTADGDDLLTRGRFWINPANGQVVQSEFITGDGRIGRTAWITVIYRQFPSVGLWLPQEMHEKYQTTDPRHPSSTIEGTATYSNYRRLERE